MPGAGAVAWLGAVAGLVAPLIIGAFVVLGGRRRRSYDAWRDTMTELGDGLNGVATAFVVVNLVVAGLLGVVAASAHHVLRWWPITIVLIVAAVGSFIFGLTACEHRCRYPLCAGTAPSWLTRLHLLTAGVVLLDIIVAPLLTWFVPQRGADELSTLRVTSVVLLAAAVLLAGLLVKQIFAKRRADEEGRASQAVVGLFERLVWVAGYGWLVLLAATLVRPGWPSLVVLGVWLAVALRFVLLPDWRDPSPWFKHVEAQPGTLSPVRGSAAGMLRVGTVKHAGQFLSELAAAMDGDEPLIVERTDDTESSDAAASLTIAFTCKGLRALDVPYDWHAPFVEDAFKDGMLARAAALGDTGPSDPAHWDDGWDDPEHLHVAFWVQARTKAERDALDGRVVKHFTSVRQRLNLATNRLTDSAGRTAREHFGFVDGVSQPWIDGVPRRDLSQARGGGQRAPRSETWKPLALGEFVVGQVDGTGDIFPVPSPPEVFLGGTFMVVRKLEQDVAGFRRFAGSDDAENELAQRLVGRTRDGHPLARQDPEVPSRNDFIFGDDPEGERCPLGAHIRRANARDALGFGFTLSARRRIIRRGMPYGSWWDDTAPEGDRGILFIAYNVRIAEQFEFVQQQWLNDGAPFGLGNCPDPIAGLWPPTSPRAVVVTGPDPRVLAHVPSVVTTRGGEYFFVPSVPGLRAMVELRPAQRQSG